MFFKWLVLGKGGVDDVGREPVDSSEIAVSVVMAHWNVEHHVCRAVFFLETVSPLLLSNSFSVVKLNAECRGAIPDRNSILRWVEAFKCFQQKSHWTVTTELPFPKKTARRQTHNALCSNAPWLLKLQCLSCLPAQAQRHQPHPCRVLAI